MAIVYNRDRQGNVLSVDQMIRKFKKMVERDGTLEDLRKRDYFISESEKRRLAKKRQIRAAQRKLSKYN